MMKLFITDFLTTDHQNYSYIVDLVLSCFAFFIHVIYFDSAASRVYPDFIIVVFALFSLFFEIQ